jgi:hypothetical protein
MLIVDMLSLVSCGTRNIVAYLSKARTVEPEKQPLLGDAPMRSVPKVYEKDKEDHLSQLSFKMPACQAMSLGAEQLSWRIERVSGDGSQMIAKRWHKRN